MDFKEQFEKPLPMINRDNKKIYIETSGNCEGSFLIKNDGGSIISGKVMSNSRFISFEPENFHGNDSKINFYIDLELYKPGDVFKSNVVILSNGGEHTMEFHIKVTPYALETKEGIKITSLKEFYRYAKEYPIQARMLFSNHEFMMWLYTSGYEYMDLYEKFLLDTNKERALDNFLIMNKLKKKADIEFMDKSISIDIPTFQTNSVKGVIPVKRIGLGYIEKNIKHSASWLNIEQDKISSLDFDSDNIAYIPYSIEPIQLKNNANFDKVTIGEKSICFKAIKTEYLKITFDREFLGFKDSGNLIIKNNSGNKVPVNIYTKDNFIKFEGTKYYIDDFARIPFYVDVPVMLTARLSISKQPSLESELYIESVFNEKIFTKTIKIVIGSF